MMNNPILHGFPRPVISIVIPSLNEARFILPTIEHARANHVEIILADGGSTDGTRALAENAGVKVIPCPRGRGRQLNEGARHASGDIVLFLHADTLLPDGFISEVITILSMPGSIAGAFRLGIVGKNWALRIVAALTNMRSVLLQLPYGDQAIFLRKERFLLAGGFPDIPIMEDYALVLRLRKMGRITISSRAVKTSGRRWDRLGLLKTTLINQLVIVGYHVGIDVDRLASFYFQQRKQNVY